MCVALFFNAWSDWLHQVSFRCQKPSRLVTKPWCLVRDEFKFSSDNFCIFRGSPKKNSSLYWKSIKLMRVISWRITCENPAPPRHIWDTSLARWAHFMCESFACPWQPVLSCRFSACSSYSGSSAYSSLLCEQNAQAVRWISNPIRNFLTTNLSFN